MLAGAERLLIEFIRRNDDFVLGLTEAQLISSLMVARRALLARAAAQRADTPSRLPDALIGRAAWRLAVAEAPRPVRARRCAAIAAQQSASATEAPAAVPSRWDASIPATPATIAVAPAAIVARPGERDVAANRDRGGDEDREHEQAAEALDGDRECGREQPEQRDPHERWADPERASAGGVEGDRAERAVERKERAAAGQRQHGGGDQVAVGHPERVAEQQLLEPRGRIGAEREQAAEAEQAGNGDRRRGVGADARVAAGECDGRRGDRDADHAAEQQRQRRRARQGPSRAAARVRATRRGS